MTRGRVRLRRRQASQASSWPASVSWRPDAPGESEACNLLVRCASSRHLWPNARGTNTTSEWTLQRRLRSGNGTAARSLRSRGGTARAIRPPRTERAAPRWFFAEMPIAPPLSAASAACSSTKKESQCRLQSCPAQSGSAIRREGAVSERCCQWWSHYCWHSVLDSLSRQQLAELNYVLARWGQSGDPNVTAVVALYTWSVTDAGTYNSHGMSDDDYVARAPSEARSTILSLLAQMRSEATAYAVTDPSLSLSLSLDMTDQYAGTLTVAANPSHLQGTADLSGAVFGDGSTSLTLGAGQFGITGTPADGASSYQIGASMSVAADGYGAKVDLYTAGASEQRIIASVAGAPGNLAASTQTPQIDLDFQPVIGTQVASRYIGEGDPFVDQLAVSVTKGTWTSLDDASIRITATGTLYGPFAQHPAEADSPPVGAPVAGTEQLTLSGAGDYTSAGSITAPSSGFYTWVWQIDKDAQGDLGRYLAGSYTDRFGRVTETAVVPFQPKAVSTAQQRLVVPGDPLTDRLVVSSVNDPWLKVDGQPIPVILEGTLYQVPGTRPPTQNAAVNLDAVPIGTVTVTATGPGSYISPVVTAPGAGFVTWVWQVKKAFGEPREIEDFTTVLAVRPHSRPKLQGRLKSRSEERRVGKECRSR